MSRYAMWNGLRVTSDRQTAEEENTTLYIRIEKKTELIMAANKWLSLLLYFCIIFFYHYRLRFCCSRIFTMAIARGDHHLIPWLLASIFIIVRRRIKNYDIDLRERMISIHLRCGRRWWYVRCACTRRICWRCAREMHRSWWNWKQKCFYFNLAFRFGVMFLSTSCVWAKKSCVSTHVTCFLPGE